MSCLERLTSALWDPWLLGAFLLTGGYFSLKTGFFQLFGLPTWLKATVGSLLRAPKRGGGRGVTQWEALCTALAATIGTGSIAGVATAIQLGGPGAVFWMWVCALLGMMTGFVEKSLAVRWRRPDGRGGWRGGPMYYLRDGLKCPPLAAWFAAACLASALIGGNLVQSNSIAAAFQASFGCDRLAAGAVTALAAGLVIAGGLGRVARVSSLLVPVMALAYLGSGAAVLIACAPRLPHALRLIVVCALDPRAALGGGTGYTVAAAMRYGVARGVFTNEAGLGTSAIAHAAADVDCPARQGMWGILETGVSTLLICTVTALAILCSGVYDPARPDAAAMGAPLTAAAFSRVLGPAGAAVVAVSLLLFAFSSILGWSCYGEQCLGYLAGGARGRGAFRALFLLFIVLGSVWDPALAWTLVDLCSALLAIPNLAALLLLSRQSLEELKQWDGRKDFRKNEFSS